MDTIWNSSKQSTSTCDVSRWLDKIADDGIYTLSKNVWTLTQTLNGLGTSIFLSHDGSIFASNLATPNVDIFSSSTTSPDTWNIISTIYGYSLGLDIDTILKPSAATSDGKTLALVSSKCYSNATTTLCDRLIFILQSNNVGSNYVLAQQLTGFPNDSSLQYNRISMSADGSILAALWTSRSCYTDPSQQTLHLCIYIHEEVKECTMNKMLETFQIGWI